ncbi:hypothetical protein TI39_contig459g00028 [Zymoseptoria brevis]|uniref:CREG-like beta-barrel domain-containing protein n=1 Tax=Zymoseptoria brevis TaxID=1047168 RepID=A0A0F4GL19_9PEZI|nr:hypothetical protein TI39_contig459g00028 [Zymoseptoria brevis]
MRLHAIVAGLVAGASAKSVLHSQPQQILSNPLVHNDDFRIPTWRESTAMARKILHLTNLGDLVTTFPEEHQQDGVETLENRPLAVAGSPIGLTEYYADCDPGSPVFLSLSVATPYRNYNAGSNISLSIRWWPQRKMTYAMWSDDDDDFSTPHTPVALPRMSLHGHLEPVSQEKMEELSIQECFVRSHPDSVWWQPGNPIHSAKYVQLVVDHVYWLGGFGDRARIGWLPMDMWSNLTMAEIMEAKLPGEKKHKEKGWWREWL